VTLFRLSPAAQRDMTDIWLYTADNWGVHQADHYNEQIEDDLGKVAAGTRIAQRVDDLWKIRSGHHLCIFDKLDDGSLWVIRVLHERMDVEGRLGE
jgi:toxin ParE1/3/4